MRIIAKKKSNGERSGNPGSVLYQLWLKSKSLLQRESADSPGEQTSAPTSPPSNAEITQAFFDEISICPTDDSWAGQEEPEAQALYSLWQSWPGPPGHAKPSFGLMTYLIGQESTSPTIPEEPLDADDEDHDEHAQEQADPLEEFQERIRDAARLLLEEEENDEGLRNAMLLGAVAPDGMTAWLFAFPPRGGGDVEEMDVFEALAHMNVVYGMDQQLVKRLIHDQQYFKILPAAHGTPPQKGEDGHLIEHIPHETSVSVTQREDGSADYKSMGKTRKISKGDIIYEVVPPTLATSGIDVFGKKRPGEDGMHALIPKLKNVELAADGLSVISSIDGHIYFEDNQFVVESLLIIDGNVDGTVGNINYDGDILINGDVCEGFTVKSTGNIVIKSMVESAQVFADGSITVEKGMNGNGTGLIHAKRDIRSKFLENCIAKAGGNIYAGSIIWSDVFCRGSLYVTSERGVLIGGKCVVLHDIVVSAVGNSSRRHIDIVLGTPPEVLVRRDQLEAELKDVQKQLTEILKDIQFLEEHQPLDARRKELYHSKKLQRPVLQMKERRMISQLGEVYSMICDAYRSTMRCDILYAPVHISIGSANILVENQSYQNCLIYESRGEVIIGKK